MYRPESRILEGKKEGNMMSKPLTVFLQILGAILILSGIVPLNDPEVAFCSKNALGITFGILLVLIGGKGIRDRFKRG